LESRPKTNRFMTHDLTPDNKLCIISQAILKRVAFVLSDKFL
jgi:hypothetical protein